MPKAWEEHSNLLSKRLANIANEGFETIKSDLMTVEDNDMKYIQEVLEKKHGTITKDSDRDLKELVEIAIKGNLMAPEDDEKINLVIAQTGNVASLISRSVQLKATVASIFFNTTPRKVASTEEKNKLVNRYSMADQEMKLKLLSVPDRVDAKKAPIGEYANWQTKAIKTEGLELPEGVTYEVGGKFQINSQQCPLALLGAYLSQKYPDQGKTLIPTLFWLTSGKKKEKAKFLPDCIEEVKWLATNDNPLLIPGASLTKGRLEFAIYLALGKCRIISPHGMSLAGGAGAVRVVKGLISMATECEKVLTAHIKDKQVANVCLGVCNIIQRFFQPRNVAILNNSRINFDSYMINGKGVWNHDIDKKVFSKVPEEEAQTDATFDLNLASEASGSDEKTEGDAESTLD
jgi:hypothetical protein